MINEKRSPATLGVAVSGIKYAFALRCGVKLSPQIRPKASDAGAGSVILA